MAKLYVFGIGGTGSRVLRSLAMILAAGVKLPGKFDTIVPIIIDPDSANGDMNRTTEILLNYQNIKENAGPTENFFNAKIKTLAGLAEHNLPQLKEHFIFDIAGVSHASFDDFIGYQKLDPVDKALIELLYTSEELNSDMEVGFKGRPNIGSIVLNQLIKNKGYEQFASKFDEGDAIFIISSIFGGTGAAGFPLLLKNLRTENPSIPGSHLISNSIIGGISYLPYFKISPPADKDLQQIDSSSFLGKAKSALAYYDHAIFKNKSLNAFYYLSDHSQNDYKYAEGKAEQENNAHFLELAGATAILDFLEDVPVLNTIDKKALGVTTKEFGIKTDTDEIDFNSLGGKTDDILKINLAKFSLMEKFLRKSLSENLTSNTRWIKEGNFTEESFFKQNFFKRYLNPFLHRFNEWLTEMEHNNVKFYPIHDKQNSDNLLNFIHTHELNNSFFTRGKAKSKKLTEALNKEFSNLKGGSSEENRFLTLFDRSTDKVVSKIIKKH